MAMTCATCGAPWRTCDCYEKTVARNNASDPKGGFLDNQFQSLVIAFAEPRLQPNDLRPVVDALLDSVDRDKLTANLSAAGLGMLHNRPTMGAINEPKVRPIMRRRFHVNAAEQYQEQHPDWSYGQCLSHARTELTDERIVAAIRQHAKYTGVASVEGVSDWFQWLKDNWSWQVFFSILGILLMFLSPAPSPHDGEMQ